MFIYIILFFLTTIFSYLFSLSGVNRLKYKYFKWNEYIVASFIICLIFIGLRYNVGRDYLAYASDYTYTTLDDFGELFSKYKIEYGFYGILLLARTLNIGPVGLFLISTFITLLLFFKLYKKNPEFLPIGIIVFFLGSSYGFIINGLRQAITLFLFLNAVMLLSSKDKNLKVLLKYSMCLCVGALFHFSIIYFIPLYVLRFQIVSNFFNRYILCSIAISGLVLNTLGFVDLFVPEVESSGGYSYEAMMETDMFVVESDGISIGKIISILLYLIPLWFYDDIKDLYVQYKIYFILLSFGSALYFLFPNNMLVARVAYYFLFSEVLVFPIFFHYLKYYNRSKFKPFLKYFIYAAWLALFAVNISVFYENQLWPNARVYGIPIN